MLRLTFVITDFTINIVLSISGKKEKKSAIAWVEETVIQQA